MASSIPGNLTQLQCDHFHRAGYLILGQLSDLTLLAELKEQIQTSYLHREQPFRVNQNDKLTHIENVYERYQQVAQLIADPVIIDNLKSLLGPNILLCKNRHNHATLNYQGGQQQACLHRDILQWSRTVITIVIYFDNTDLNNGCTHLIPGSHLLPYVGTPNNGGTWLDEHSIYHSMAHQELPIPAKAGSVLAFNGLVFHRVGENKTSKPRASMTFAFRSVDELSEYELNSQEHVLVAGENIYRGNDVFFYENKSRK